MARKSKTYTPKFKFQLVLEVLSAEHSGVELGCIYGVHHTTISKWKRHFLEHGAEVFGFSEEVGRYEKRIGELERLLGQNSGGCWRGRSFIFLALSIRVVRWRRILWNQKMLSFRDILVPLLVGQMAVQVLPARTGELYRAHYLSRRAKMSRSGVVGRVWSSSVPSMVWY